MFFSAILYESGKVCVTGKIKSDAHAACVHGTISVPENKKIVEIAAGEGFLLVLDVHCNVYLYSDLIKPIKKGTIYLSPYDPDPDLLERAQYLKEKVFPETVGRRVISIDRAFGDKRIIDWPKFLE